LAFATFLVGGYGLALAALALVIFGAIERTPITLLGWPWKVEDRRLNL